MFAPWLNAVGLTCKYQKIVNQRIVSGTSYSTIREGKEGFGLVQLMDQEPGLCTGFGNSKLKLIINSRISSNRKPQRTNEAQLLLKIAS